MEQPALPKVDSTTTEKAPRKKPERRPLGDEMLVMGRCLRELQTLESGAARVRVAQYLLSRALQDPPEQKSLPFPTATPTASYLQTTERRVAPAAQEGGTPEVGSTLLD